MCEADCETNFTERLIFLLGGTTPGLQCHPPDLEALSVLTSANLDLLATAAKKKKRALAYIFAFLLLCDFE